MTNRKSIEPTIEIHPSYVDYDAAVIEAAKELAVKFRDDMKFREMAKIVVDKFFDAVRKQP